MQKTLRAKCKNKRRIEASMVEAFITEEAANFVTAHYEAKNRHLHNPKPRYNTGDPQRRQYNLSLFKGKLGPVGASRNRYEGRDLRLAREGSGSCAPTSG